eukprot:scaffold83971_cov84-Attheya_sp.AAC.4
MQRSDNTNNGREEAPYYMCVCNPASTTPVFCPTMGGGIPTRTGRLRAATLWGRDIMRMPTSIGVVGMVRAAWATYKEQAPSRRRALHRSYRDCNDVGRIELVTYAVGYFGVTTELRPPPYYI